jgi:hypothetical protein
MVADAPPPTWLTVTVPVNVGLSRHAVLTEIVTPTVPPALTVLLAKRAVSQVYDAHTSEPFVLVVVAPLVEIVRLALPVPVATISGEASTWTLLLSVT